jgi:hypothetical protein
LLLLFLKGKQLQAGADWDSVIGISIGLLLIASMALIIALVISRVIHARRFKRAQMRSLRRHNTNKL